MNCGIITPFRLISLEVELTDTGIKNYTRVLAIIFAYLKLVKDKWLANDKPLDLFTETKTMSHLSFEVYQTQEAEDHTVAISQTLLYTLNPSKVLKEIYSVPIISEINVADIRSILSEFTYEKCKVTLIGNGILTRKDVVLPKSLKANSTEPRFGAKYRLHTKPILPKENTRELKRPEKNKFIPDKTSVIVSKADIKLKNDEPALVSTYQSGAVQLYHVLDHVYLKSQSSIVITLRIGNKGRFLRTPEELATFRVAKHCLKETISKRVGYEASLA